jgi:hypothetical protein
MAAIMAAIPVLAHAQPAQDRGRFFVGAGIGWQFGSESAEESTPFALYGEEGEIRTTYDYSPGGALLDVEFGVALTRKLSVAVLHTRTASKYDAPFVVDVPHPLFENQHRSAEGEATDLRHSEKALHVQVAWLLNERPRWDISLTGGPSFIQVERDAVAGVIPGAETPPFDTVPIADTIVVPASGEGVGFNLGAEGVYGLNRLLGLRTFVRFVYVPVTTDVNGDEQDVTAGGFQLGATLRLRF